MLAHLFVVGRMRPLLRSAVMTLFPHNGLRGDLQSGKGIALSLISVFQVPSSLQLAILFISQRYWLAAEFSLALFFSLVVCVSACLTPPPPHTQNHKHESRRQHSQVLALLSILTASLISEATALSPLELLTLAVSLRPRTRASVCLCLAVDASLETAFSAWGPALPLVLTWDNPTLRPFLLRCSELAKVS